MINFYSNLISNKGKIIVGCSGGIDSIACAHFLRKVNPEISLFHFNHKLRKQNDLMEKAVKEFEKEFDFAESYYKNAEEFPISTDRGVEAGARDSRIAALNSLFFGGCRVIVCHHLNDNVETYLMNCFDGKDVNSLIPPHTKFNNFELFRPFLMTPKKVLSDYIDRNNLKRFIVEDDSNYTNEYKRNFVRNNVIPLVGQYFQGLERIVSLKTKEEYERVVRSHSKLSETQELVSV